MNITTETRTNTNGTWNITNYTFAKWTLLRVETEGAPTDWKVRETTASNVHISIDWDNNIEVSWSSIGSVTPEEAAIFGQDVALASVAAKEFERIFAA